MINGIFWFFMNCIGHIVEFIIVAGIIGFFLMLPFLLKGGWIIGMGYILWGSLAIIGGIDRWAQEREREKNENRD